MTEIPGGGVWIGKMPQHSAGAPGASTMFAMDTSGEKQGVVIRIPKTGTLDKFEFMMSTLTNLPDNGIRLSFQDVDATGFPDGTQDQYRDIASGSLAANTWTAPGLMTHDGTDGGNKRSVTEGDVLACVFEFVSFVASDSITIASITTSTGRDNFAYTVNYTGAAWNKGSFATLQLRIALKYDDGTYVFLSPEILPIVGFASTTFASNSTPDEYALRFQVPFDCEVSGVEIRMSPGAAFDLVLYDSGGSTLFTQTIDNDQSITGAGSYAFAFPTTSLTANSTYRLAVRPSTVVGVTFYNFTVSSNAYLQSVPGGIEFYQSTRTNAGAWTDSDITRPWMFLRLTSIDIGSSGGGATSAIYG